MAVRDLGYPGRFALTAGQKGDAPQAEALLQGLPADVVLADAAYDSDRVRDIIARKRAKAVIPNNPHAHASTISTAPSTPSGT